MIPENRSNRVFYSAKWSEACPKTYRNVTAILDKYGVPHSALQGTNDIWVRDFMPIQVSPGEFKIYNYLPDYLRDYKKYQHLISDPIKVCKKNNIHADTGISAVRMDGGNVVHGGLKVIMTAKVFEENPWGSIHDLPRLLQMHSFLEIL